MVSGWSDVYRDSVLTMLEHHPRNTKGLIGPWEHAWPQDAGVGPKADFLDEAVRWYDHWLKGAANGVMDEPRLHAYIDDAYPAEARVRRPPGALGRARSLGRRSRRGRAASGGRRRALGARPATAIRSASPAARRRA